MEYSLYVLRNRVNNKHYVGQTKYYPLQRLAAHVNNSRRPSPKAIISRAIKKHGEDSFQLIKTLHCPKEQADNLEAFLVSLYNSKVPNGYNVLDYGQVVDTPNGWWQGKPRPEETKLKISRAKKGTGVGPDNPFYGKTHSEESKRKNSEATKKWWRNFPEERREEYSKNLSKALVKTWASRSEEEIKAIGHKISRARKGMKRSKEAREKDRLVKLGHKQSPETIKKRAQALKGKVRTEEMRTNYRRAQRANVPEESKEKIIRIYNLLKEGRPPLEVSKEIGCSPSYVYSIRNGKKGLSALEPFPVLNPNKDIKRKSRRKASESAKLTTDIYEMLDRGAKVLTICKELGVSKPYVYKIKSKDLNPQKLKQTI